MQLTAATILLALSLSTSTLAAPAYTDSGDAYAVCYSLDECYYTDSDVGNQYGQSGSGPFSYSDVAAAGEYYGYGNNSDNGDENGNENGNENDNENNNDTTTNDTTNNNDNENDNENENENDNENETNNNGRRDIHDASRRRPWFLRPHHHHKNNRRAIPSFANIGASTGVNVTAGAGADTNTNTNNSGSTKCCSELVDASRLLSGVTTDVQGLLSGLPGSLGSSSAGLNLGGNGGLNLSGRDGLDALNRLTFGLDCETVSGSDAQCDGTLATCSGGILNLGDVTQELDDVVALGCKATN